MPMYDTSYVAPPTPHQLACKEQQDFYAKYIKDQNLFETLEQLEFEHEKAVEQLSFLKENNLIFEVEAIALKEHLEQSRKDLDETRLIIEQLDRASKGEAYGEGLHRTNGR